MMRYSWTRTRWSGTVRSRATSGGESVGAGSPRGGALGVPPHDRAQLVGRRARHGASAVPSWTWAIAALP